MVGIVNEPKPEGTAFLLSWLQGRVDLKPTIPVGRPRVGIRIQQVIHHEHLALNFAGVVVGTSRVVESGPADQDVTLWVDRLALGIEELVPDIFMLGSRRNLVSVVGLEGESQRVVDADGVAGLEALKRLGIRVAPCGDRVRASVHDHHVETLTVAGTARDDHVRTGQVTRRQAIQREDSRRKADDVLAALPSVVSGPEQHVSWELSRLWGRWCDSENGRVVLDARA